MKNNDDSVRMKGKEKASLLSAFSFLISKAFLLSAFCFLLSTSLYAATSEEKRFVDVNGDGNITTADAALIYSYILGTADAKVTLEQVDVNGDGAVNTLDVVEVYVAMNTPEEPDDMEGQGTDTNNDYDFGGRGK